MSEFLKRLREPSTYAGIAAFFALVHANIDTLAPGAETVSIVIVGAAVLMAIVAVFLPEKSKE